MTNEEKLMRMIPQHLHGEAVVVLSRILNEKKPIVNFGVYTPDRVEDVEKIVCEIWGIERDRLVQKNRLRTVVSARQFMYYYLRHGLNWTMQKIAKRYRMHHASVVHHLLNLETLCLYDKAYKVKFAQFTEIINIDNNNDKPSETTPTSDSDTGHAATDVLVHRTVSN